MLIVTSCSKNDDQKDYNNYNINNLEIHGNFNYETYRMVQVEINDPVEGVIYSVYTINDDTENKVVVQNRDTIIEVNNLNAKVFRGMVTNNKISASITIPSFHKYLHIVRNDHGGFSTDNVLVEDIMSYEFTGELKSTNEINNIIYSVNQNKEFYAIDAITGEVTDLGQLPCKSIACAVDKVNRKVYFANKQNPFELYYYDIDLGTYTQTGNLLNQFPRMDYSQSDGMLYISTQGNQPYLYKIDPSTGQYVQSYKINGLHQKGWGDQAFNNEGELYILTKSGVYETTFDGNEINTNRISSSDLPGPLTSATFDEAGNLWMSKNPSKSRVVLFDVNNKTWQWKEISQNIKINDFGSLTEYNVANDSDGDGVPDDQDDYPNDPDKAFNNFSPEEETWATLAFEDLWPGVGDYDFNDLVLFYNMNQITNAQNEVVQIICDFYVDHIGATLDNGFGIELNTDPSTIQSVSGYSLQEGYIQLAANGTEENQSKAVIILFENADNHLNESFDLNIEFSTPVSTNQLGSVPYNPFLIKNGDRGFEIHLPDMPPTDLADPAIFNTFNDDSNPNTGRYYKTENNLPWGINIVYEFVYPLEKQEITKGYLKFAEWAESGGSEYANWYLDKPGYRDNEYLSDY